MNRKLLRTMTALSASATVFAVLLLAGRPVGLPATATALPQHAATLPAEAALAGDEAGLALPADDGVDATGTPVAAGTVPHAHGAQRSRALLALPYFSFAQGLRRSRS